MATVSVVFCFGVGFEIVALHTAPAADVAPDADAAPGLTAVVEVNVPAAAVDTDATEVGEARVVVRDVVVSVFGVLLPQPDSTPRAAINTNAARVPRPICPHIEFPQRVTRAASISQLDIAELAAREELKAIRPEMNGSEVMAHLGLTPGPTVGRAMKFLLELRLDEGVLGDVEVRRRLDEWWQTNAD